MRDYIKITLELCRSFCPHALGSWHFSIIDDSRCARVFSTTAPIRNITFQTFGVWKVQTVKKLLKGMKCTEKHILIKKKLNMSLSQRTSEEKTIHEMGTHWNSIKQKKNLGRSSQWRRSYQLYSHERNHQNWFSWESKCSYKRCILLLIP